MTDDIKALQKGAQRDRSTAYPAISLEDAVTYSRKLASAYPKSDFDREAAVKAMGYDSISGASSPKVAALAHYGLLDRKGGTYKNSDLATRIHYFETEQDKKDAILEAVTRPKLFNSLVNEYSDLAIPATLNNVLISKHRISSKVANKVVQTFKDSLEYAGMYENGVLKSKLDSETNELKVKSDSSGDSDNLVEEPKKQIIQSQVSGMHNVPLSNGVIVSYPSDIAFNMQTNIGYIEALKGLEEVAKEAITDESQ